MTIELIVMFFDQDEVTPNTWRALNTLRKTRAFGLENAALVERDAAGKAFIQHYKRYPAWGKEIDDTFMLLFTNAIFKDNAGDHERDMLIAEFDEFFISGLERLWRPSNSALLIFIPRESLVDTSRLLNYLAGYSGTLIHTTIPVRTIESILAMSPSDELSSVKNME